MSFSRIAGPQEPEIQGEPHDEDALLPRVGSPLEYAGNSGENQEGGAPESGGGNFSFLRRTKKTKSKRRTASKSPADPAAALLVADTFRRMPLRETHVQYAAGKFIWILERRECLPRSFA